MTEPTPKPMTDAELQSYIESARLAGAHDWLRIVINLDAERARAEAAEALAAERLELLRPFKAEMDTLIPQQQVPHGIMRVPSSIVYNVWKHIAASEEGK